MAHHHDADAQRLIAQMLTLWRTAARCEPVGADPGATLVPAAAAKRGSSAAEDDDDAAVTRRWSRAIASL